MHSCCARVVCVYEARAPDRYLDNIAFRYAINKVAATVVYMHVYVAAPAGI